MKSRAFCSRHRQYISKAISPAHVPPLYTLFNRFFSLVVSGNFCQHIIYATRPLCRPIIDTRPLCRPIMTSTSFDADNYMPDWTEDFDFGAFLNLPNDEGDQGVMTGSVFFLLAD